MQQLAPVFENKTLFDVKKAEKYFGDLAVGEKIIKEELRIASGCSGWTVVNNLLRTLSCQNMLVSKYSNHGGDKQFFKKRDLTETEILEASKYRHS